MKDKKILVVDDEPHILKLIELTLKLKEFEVITASVGHEALTLAETHLPNLIILDVMMPGLNGFEAAKIIKENELTKHIPILFLTSKSQFSDELKGYEAGAVEYLKKPIDPQFLLNKVDQYVQ
ncbi:response regulator [Candidatus Woesearchaeota archaeon]|jgi:DNA-binding response OmpR family regulator|nr:response regulator [Candidatus Woesearchaeota archaeon]MBT4387726.1 response regulator [Candidatus Woesearchaeota archaeon]MBT4595545.1 response regulator [Candidatus Woesearchaeota archaeon]MBT5740972.1 response regulator [Candidatus Woesearchaeota archaeon]MBT7849526.1 response regulator [Candidatus Woesearchaeota archaeon]